MKTALIATALLLAAVSQAKADGVQVCVDSKGATYTAKVTGFAKAHADWSGIISSANSASAIASGTDLNKITFKGNLGDVDQPDIQDLYYALKHVVAPTTESVLDSGDYKDEPRVYQASGVDLLCSSTMSQDEFENLAK